MFIAVSKSNNEIILFGKRKEIMFNGYPKFIDENIAFPPELATVYEISEIPSEIVVGKYCYTPEKGFYLNPDWTEPPKPEEKYTLDEAAAIIASEVSHG